MVNLLILSMMKALSSFLMKLNSHQSYTFTSPLQQILKQNHGASHGCYSVKIMSKLLVFNWLLNELLLEIEGSEVMLTWCFVSIKFNRSF